MSKLLSPHLKVFSKLRLQELRGGRFAFTSTDPRWIVTKQKEEIKKEGGDRLAVSMVGIE